MTRLLLAELSRLRSRRLSLIALIGIVLVVAAMQIAVAQAVKPLTQAELAEGQQQYNQAKQDYEQNKAQYQADEQQCINDGTPADQCSQEPKPEYYTTRQPLPFADVVKVVASVAVFLTSLIFLLVGASFIGAEYSSGALANWLSFIPERGKVFASKLLALVLAAAVVSALSTGLTLALAAIVTRAVGADVKGVKALVELGGRGIVVGVICAVVGFCLAMLTRHTIAAAGTVLGYLFVTGVLSAVYFVIPALANLKAWLPENNLLALLNHGYTYVTNSNLITEDGVVPQEAQHTITVAHSLGYWGVILLVLIGGTFAVFRRRDVN